MTKIRISTKQNAFVFSISQENREKSNGNINLTQTNIINTDSMIFTTNYIYKNIDIVSSFISGLATQRQITKISIKDMDLANLALLIVQNIKQINEINILTSEELSYEVYERILFSNYIKKVSCYNLKPFMIEQLDKKNIDVSVKNEIFFVSKFMEDNLLENYASIYYKRVIEITHELDEKDLEDFTIFCKTNKYLKSINLTGYSKECIRNIINILAREKKHNIKINIIQNKDNINLILNSIDYLKVIQSKVKKNYNYKLSIIYSDEYKNENLVNQITINNIKICCILIIITVVIAIAVIEYNNVRAVKNINDINNLISNEINDISSVYDSSSSSIDLNSDISPYSSVYKDIFSKLIDKNSETVGYIKVNNTKVDYPVVKTIDNKYYLTHDFYNNRNTFGWVFMDYKNNPKDLDDNTIIYGHNTHREIMFATLINCLKEDWYTNPINQIISYNSPYYAMEWQIFSIYKIETTSDYLTTNFVSEEDFNNFITLIKGRSIYDFKISILPEDKILTLSTCIDGNKGRAVIHAKLISKKAIG